jgi:hypothetical protein
LGLGAGGGGSYVTGTSIAAGTGAAGGTLNGSNGSVKIVF